MRKAVDWVRGFRPRNVLMHMHLFKNAGTTVDWALARCFGSSFATTDKLDQPESVYSPSEVEEFLCWNAGIRACSSHQFAPPFPERHGLRLHPFAFVRHPLDRVFSVYAFEKKQGQYSASSRLANQCSLPEYVEAHLSSGPTSVIHNFHISRLSRSGRGAFEGSASEGESLAMRRWQELSLGGVVERFDESMVLLEERLKPFFPEIDLAYVRQNTSRGRLESLDQRVEEGLAALPDPVRDRLLHMNQSDLRFYDWAVSELDRSLSKVPGFQEKLNQYLERCDKLSDSSPEP